MQASDLAALVAAHKWYALAAVLVGFLIRLLKDDTVLPTVPARVRPWLAVGAGVVAIVLDKLAAGSTWQAAIINGAIVGGLPIVAHQLGIESLLGGKEVPLPAPLLDDGKPKPPTVPPMPLLLLASVMLLGGCSWFTPARDAKIADSVGCVFEHWGQPPLQIAAACAMDVVDVVEMQKTAQKYGVTPKKAAP